MAEVDLTELAIILQDTLTRIDNLVFTTGAPSAELGTINSVALDVVAKVLYGPKTTLGWGAGTLLTGADGRDPEFRAAGGYLQTRLIGDTDWQNLIPIADLPEGPPGLTPVISIGTVTTAPTGDPAEASFTGTAEEPVLNLTLPRGGTGLTGADGWTAVEANVVDGARRVKQIVDWVGGTGTKPATGKYVGPAGLVDTAAEATDVRGPGGAGSGDMIGANNGSDFTDVGQVRTNISVYSRGEVDTAITGCATDAELALLQGDVDDLMAAVGAISVPVKATGVELRTGTDDAKFATAKSLTDADAWVEVTTSGAWVPDFAAGRNFSVILNGALTFNAPTNMKDGQSGAIRFQQDATGARTIGVNAAIKKVGSYTLSTAANAVDRCGYIVKGTVLELTALEKGIA